MRPGRDPDDGRRRLSIGGHRHLGAAGGFRAEFVEVSGGEVLVVHGHGELDLAIRHEVRTAVAEAERARRTSGSPTSARLARLVVDLSAATYLGATTIATLVEEAERTSARGTPRLVVGRGGVVGRVAALLDLGEIFEVFEDLDDALCGEAPTH